MRLPLLSFIFFLVTPTLTWANHPPIAIQDYVARSEQKLDAYELEAHFSAEASQNLTDFGTLATFKTNTTPSHLSMTALSSSQILVAYRDVSDNGKGKIVLGNVQSDQVVFGTEYTFNSDKTKYISIDKLSSDKFAIAYRQHNGSSPSGKVVIGTVSGNSLSFGTEAEFYSDAVEYVDVTALSESKIVINFGCGAWYNGFYIFPATVVVGDVSGSSLSLGSPQIYGNYYAYYIKAIRVNDTTFLMANKDKFSGYWLGVAAVGTVSGTTATMGAYFYTFNNAHTTNIDLGLMENGSFVVGYADGGFSYRGSARVGQIKDYTITYGDEYVFEATQVSSISVVPVSSSRVGIAYEDVDNSGKGTIVYANVGGTILDVETPEVFHEANVSEVHMVTLGDESIIPAYSDGSGAGAYFGSPTSSFPVELLEFNAEMSGDQVFLNWATATELNNHGFEVERSLDGNAWQSIEFVPGQGTTSDIHRYRAVDASPLPGLNQYRLKQVDFDGSYTFTNVVSINFGLENYLRAFPNPTKGQIEVMGLPVEASKISLMDQSGRLIRKLERTHTQFDISDLQPGVYFLKVQHGTQVLSTKIFKE